MPQADFKRWFEDVYARIMEWDARLTHPDWRFFAPVIPKGLPLNDRKDALSTVLTDAYIDIVRPSARRTAEVRARNKEFIAKFVYVKKSPEFLRRQDPESTLLFTDKIKKILKPYVSSTAGRSVADIPLDRAVQIRAPLRGDDSDSDDVLDVSETVMAEEPDVKASSFVTLKEKKKAQEVIDVVCDSYGIPRLTGESQNDVVNWVFGDLDISEKVKQEGGLGSLRGQEAGLLFEIVVTARSVLSELRKRKFSVHDALEHMNEDVVNYENDLFKRN